MVSKVVGKVNKIRVIAVERIAPDVLVQEDRTTKEKVSKYERADKQEAYPGQCGGEKSATSFQRVSKKEHALACRRRICHAPLALLAGNKRPWPRILAHRNANAVPTQPKP